MAIEIVDLPIENHDFPVRHVTLSEGTFLNMGRNSHRPEGRGAHQSCLLVYNPI